MKKLITVVLMAMASVSFGSQATQVQRAKLEHIVAVEKARAERAREKKAREIGRLLEESTNAKLEAGNNRAKQARIYYTYSSKLKKYGVELKKPDIGMGKGLNEKRTPKSSLGRGFSSGPARRRR